MEFRVPAGGLPGHGGGVGRHAARKSYGADRAPEESRSNRRTAALRTGHDPEDESGECGALAHEPELDARIQSFELAFRMQTEAPEAFDISKESEATKKLYGLDEPETAILDGSA